MWNNMVFYVFQGGKMPVTQLYEPANEFALVRDHENDLSDDEDFFRTELDFFKTEHVSFSTYNQWCSCNTGLVIIKLDVRFFVC